VPFIISWPKEIQKGQTSDALVCQIDFLSSFANYFGSRIPQIDELDSENIWESFIGKDKTGREFLVRSAGTNSITKGHMKYILPSKGQAVAKLTNIELGNNPEDQLYDLEKDPGEKNNIAKQNPKIVKELKEQLIKIRGLK
jgi:arylsulfatase A-like enzyme